MSQVLFTKSGRPVVLPTEEEDVQINAGIATDPDTYEPTGEEFKRFRRVSPGRPLSDVTKERITIRLSPDVLAAFRATGKGWQAKIDQALKDWVSTHELS